MSRRGKSVDIAHFSTSLARMPSRLGGASMVSHFTLSERPRTPKMHNFVRYTRHGVRHMTPQQTEFRIRTSVADLVMKELDDFDRCIFYQRVYILTKNVTLMASPDSSISNILDKYMQSKSSLNFEDGLAEEQVEEEGEVEMSEMGFDELSQMAPKSEVEIGNSDLQTRTSKEAPLLKLTRADFEASLKERRMQELDFFDQFKDKVDSIIKKCETEQLSDDQFTGLFLCMGNSHTLFVLEGTEDSIALFCHELLEISQEYFEIMRIFLVEDRIEETYFDDFLYRRSVAMNINEKFPPPTANDPQLMGSQHWLIKEKLRIICQTLSDELRPKVEVEFADEPLQSIIQIVEEEVKPPKKRLKPKRKKIRKRAKSPTTQVAAAAAQTQAEGAPSSVASIRSQALEGEPSVHSTAAASLGGAGSMAAASTAAVSIGAGSISEKIPEVTEGELLEQQSEVDNFPPPPLRTSAAPELINEGAIKSEDIGRSNVKLDSVATVLGEEPTVTEEMEDELTPKELLNPFLLNPVIYNRLLPEIQRIELVLTSKRFYLDVGEFVRFAQQIPVQQDEDALIWPTSYSYLPLNVFERLPFDVNLTFGNYDAKEAEEGESDSSEEEGKEEGETAKGDKKEG